MDDHRTTDVGFADALADHGRRDALITPGGASISYVELAERVEAVVEQLGAERRLIALEADGTQEAIITYLAAIRGRHPVALVAPGTEGLEGAGPLRTYGPSARAGRDDTGAWVLHLSDVAPAHDMHPDLAVLLSTSGTTGSSKLVRLSGTNIEANARSIAAYLHLDERDRAITTLPMHYCYGLSVVNSHLLCGASLILNDLSVVDECFWQRVDRYGATNFAGVPHTFDLLDRTAFDQRETPSLRFITQAGGRLAPERVLRYAELGQRRGWDLFVMYGQTEATARMAYLPPQEALREPGAIGVPIEGGTFTIDRSVLDDDERTAWGDDVGELVYRGPNVMMGYATDRSDLALGRTVDELRTGDLARLTPGGLHQIVGRRSRFLKLFGLRIDLEQVERLAAARDVKVWCTGDDRGLVVALVGDVPEHFADEVAVQLGIPSSAVAVVSFVDDIPRLPSGKPDYVGICATADVDAQRTAPCQPKSVAAIFSSLLGRAVIEPTDTFLSLGGDSLSYVEASIHLERIIGSVPSGWHTMSVAELDALEHRTGRLHHVECNVALRAVAITAVVGGHFGAFRLPSGASILLGIAGFNFARFQLPVVVSTASVRPIMRTVGRILVPALLAIVLFPASMTLGRVLMTESYRTAGSYVYGMWFIEVLLHVLLICAAMLAIPWFRDRRRRSPFHFAATLTAATLVMRFASIPLWRADSADLKVTHTFAWIFALGWMIQEADTVRRRLLCTAIVVLGFAGFGESVDIHVVAVAGMLALIWVPMVVVPPPVHLVMGALASASLYIYLTHYPATDWMPAGHPVPRTAVALVAGVVLWWLFERMPAAVRRRWSSDHPTIGRSTKRLSVRATPASAFSHRMNESSPAAPAQSTTIV